MLEVGTIWRDRCLIYDAKRSKILKGYEGEVHSYLSSIGNRDKYNVWYDTHEKKSFSLHQPRETFFGKDHNVNSYQDEFLTKAPNGKKYAEQTLAYWAGPFLKQAKNTIVNEHCIYSNPDGYFEDYRGKDLLVICGGPSVNDVSWENLEYDYVWSCNEFYLNEKIIDNNIKVDLTTMTPHFDLLGNTKLEEYVKRNNTKVSFEVERGRIPKEVKKVKYFANEYPKNSMFFHTWYRSAPGIGPRLVVYAMMTGAKNIYVVGLDGRHETETDNNLMHAFNGHKKVPNWFRTYGPRFQIRQFVVFWDYVQYLKEKNDVNVYNLGENCDYNVSSAITKSISPLPKHIEEKIS